MARRVFFSFDFEHDVFRANQVRNVNVVGVERAGYYDHSEYEKAKKKGIEAIRRMILGHLADTTVTVLLIGTRTATRPWVKFEIAESVKRGNGLLCIRIHHLAAPPAWNPRAPRSLWHPSASGPLPALLPGVECPVYGWDGDPDRFRKAIEAAGKRADKIRAEIEGRKMALRATARQQVKALRVSPPLPVRSLSELLPVLPLKSPERDLRREIELAARRRAIERLLEEEPPKLSSFELMLARMRLEGKLKK